MASPPYRSPATSPPGPAAAALPNPRKRPLTLTTNTAPYVKKRKASSFSTTASSAHPLRQTSFPPEEFPPGAARSPSVESGYTAATGGAFSATAPAPKKRGRKRKDEAQSVKSAETPGPGRGRDAQSRTGPGEDSAEDDDEGDGEGDALAEVEESSKIDKAAEQKRMNVLIDSFNADQSERYDTFRRVKLKKETVRRIVNQTLSQSVPPSVVTTINGFTKVFIGVLIEGAREVQAQQAIAAQRSLPTPPPASSPPIVQATGSTATEEASNSTSASWRRDSGDISTAVKHEPSESPKGTRLPETADASTSPMHTKNLGPLLPDHFREALRRYRTNGEGGGAGMEGRSIGLGLTGSAAMRLRGRPLFR